MDFDSDDESGMDKTAKVDMACIDEKVAAICALGHFSVATPYVFQNYFPRIIDMLD